MSRLNFNKILNDKNCSIHLLSSVIVLRTLTKAYELVKSFKNNIFPKKR